MNTLSEQFKTTKTRRAWMIGTRFGIYFLIALGILCGASAARANNIYIAQSSAGSANGASCANAYAVTWFNTSANWGSGSSQIGPGTTVYLCGTITTELSISGSGTNGNPIIIGCAAGGCDLTAPASNLINLNGQNYVTFDGGYPCGPSVTTSNCTGIAENTANGTGLANQASTKFIDGGSGSGNIEIRNWLVRNLYVHTSTSDTAIDQTADCAFYANGTSGNFNIHDNTFHDIGWVIEFQGYGSTPTITINNNYFYNYDHGVATANPSTDTATLIISNNHFGTTANWDTTADAYHHDGIHMWGSGSGINYTGWNAYIFNNLFDGNWGANNTTHIYLEDSPTATWIFNNVHIQYPGDYLNNGFVDFLGTGYFNNTIVGANVSLQNGAQNIWGTPLQMSNNVISGVSQFVSIYPGSGSSFAAGNPSNNIYAAVGGGVAPFVWKGTNENTFANWQSVTGGDASPSAQVSSAGLSSTGLPQSGSVVIGAGKNLTSLCSGVLSALCSSTSAGGMVTPQPRPASGPWDVGAYQYASGSSTQPAPPTGLTVTVQ